MKSSSPYLADSNRLADVIAAIQAMSTYKFYKLSFARWADRISADENKAPHWQKVFEDHPEFFRLDTERKNASLVWRRQYPKLYDVDSGKVIAAGEYDALDEAAKARVSRAPLTPPDIKTLIDAAINLHSRAVEHQRETRWLIPVLTGLASGIASFCGAFSAIFLKS